MSDEFVKKLEGYLEGGGPRVRSISRMESPDPRIREAAEVDFLLKHTNVKL